MSILGVLLRKEFLQFGRNKFFPRMVLIFPILIMLLLPWVTTMDIKHINVGLVDKDNSTLSHRIISKLSHSEYFTLSGIYNSYNEAFRILETGRTDIILEIPSGYEKSIISGSPKRTCISANSVNATKGSFGAQYLSRIVIDSGKDFITASGMNVPSNLTTTFFLYNPYMEYRNIMIPAFFVILMILICGFLPGLNIINEKETGTIEQINVTPVNSFTFIMAKIIPYWIIGFFVLTLSIIIAWLIYGLSPIGSLIDIYFSSALFLFFISGFGVICANISSTMLQGMLIMFFFIMVNLLMSGLLTPVSSMPRWAQYIAAILPPKYFIEIMRGIYLKGATLTDMWQSYTALGVFAIITDIIAALTYRKRI